jgi:dienelactone hydrolase
MTMRDIAVPYFCALPAGPPPWPGIVLVMEAMGITPQLLRVCERLAAEGYAVGAPDLFWRFGGSDEWISRDDLGLIEKQHPGQVVVYENAGHGFMRDGSDHFDEQASADAWNRLLSFFDEHLRRND